MKQPLPIVILLTLTIATHVDLAGIAGPNGGAAFAPTPGRSPWEAHAFSAFGALMPNGRAALYDGDQIITNHPEAVDLGLWDAYYGFYRHNGCTGVMLTAHWVITSAHCLPAGSHARPFLQIKRQVRETLERPVVYEGSATVYRHPSWSGAGDVSDDIAVVRLFKSGIPPEHLVPATIYADDRQPWDSASAEIATAWITGAGKTSMDCQTQRSYTGTRMDMSRWQLRRIGSTSALEKRMEIDLSGSPTYLCDGDSGGPWSLVRNRTHLIFAITSGGSPAGPPPYITGHGTGVLAKMNWIASVAGATSSPITCRYTRNNTWPTPYRYLQCRED